MEILEIKNWLFITEMKLLEYYKGLLVQTDSGVHVQAIS